MKKTPPNAEVKTWNGAPTLFINGQAHSAMSYMTYGPDKKYFKDIGKQNIHLYSFSATPTSSTYNLSKECWVGPDEHDYSGLDERAQMILDSDPDAYFFPRLYLGAPEWWTEQHEDELVLADSGDGELKPYLVGKKRVASCASEPWQRDTADAIRKLIQHVEASPYADRVVGYHVAGLITEEWMQWGGNDDQWCDYSPANVARFRQWLRDKYGDDAALQQAWNDKAVTLDTAAVPGFTKRAASEKDYLRDPGSAQDVIDYVLYNSWLVADTIKRFCAVVKDETKRERLAGVFYGYILLLAGVSFEQNAGHLALQDMLTCPDIDFATSPSSYAFRELGTGFCHAMAPVDSLKMHNKLWFDENDYRTWLVKGVPAGGIGRPATYEGTLLQQQREFAWVLVNRLGMWWFDMGGGWYDDPRMLRELGNMQRIADDCVGVQGESAAEIAYVVDTRSSAYVKAGNAFTKTSILNQLLPLGHIGAPFDSLHLGDLGKARPYKLYIFPNCLAPSDEERAIIEDKVLGSGASVLWLGPAGLYRDGKLDESGMEDLTGLPLSLWENEISWVVAPSPEAIEWGWAKPERFGHESVKGIVATMMDTGGLDVLGHVSVQGHPGVAVKDRGDAFTAFAAVPPLPASLLRAFAAKAGVHLYSSENDIVWASKDLLAVSVQLSGRRRVALPDPRDVTCLWSGASLGEKVTEFDVDVPDYGTALLRLG